MYKVVWKDENETVLERDFDNLAPAMEWAKTLSLFVTITGGQYDIVGKFGVDSVKDGVCPDGIEYSWYKRRKP